MQPRAPTLVMADLPDGSVVRCTGDIGPGTVEEFRRSLARPICMGLTRVDVDLMNVGRMDSTAVRYLLQAQRELRSRNGSLRILAGPRSGPMLRLLGLHAVLDVVSAGCCGEGTDLPETRCPDGSRRDVRRKL